MKKKTKDTSKYLLFNKALNKEEKARLDYEINRYLGNKGVILTTIAVVSVNNVKVNATFYNEIVSVKKIGNTILLYDEKNKLIDTLVGTKECSTDLILQQLKNRNPKIKRIREKDKKKVKRVNRLQRFYDGLTDRQQEIFYAEYLLLDLIMYLVVEMMVIFSLVDKCSSIISLLSIVTFAVSVYICKKMSNKYMTYWLKGVYYVLLIIKAIICIMCIDVF